ncbi:hypothetical protein [Microvirga aerophila]|uniref:Uncharacterized protein n=1 Tax=Microvirga aerophila TaxID=670291 RepID=A0A512BYH6_9HYPH|nr:hypothetical protein [Microvirga aerophila]GEO17011.1 hypothetical protein MAE02_47070 [Microvirga aerophila]
MPQSAVYVGGLLILRFDRDFEGEGEGFYHSCEAHQLLFGKAEGAWKTTSITQEALRSGGNRQLHEGSWETEV